MRQELEAWGAKTTTERPEADVFVVNTCTVTNQADADARRFISRLQREVPSAQIVVTGCSAALNPDAYLSMDGVSGVVEGHDPVAVASLVASNVPVQIEIRSSLARIDTEPIGGERLRMRRGAARGWL